MREKQPFNTGWSFHYGELPTEQPLSHISCYRNSKNAYRDGVHDPNYIEVNWSNYIKNGTKLELPHDFVIELTPKMELGGGRGFLLGETSLYRKVFTLDESYRGKHLSLYFEGIAIHSEIYVNGCLLKQSFSAYVPIDVDITDVALFGDQKNVVVVKAIIPDKPEGWWYQGGGIYRNVWLIATDKVYVDLYGVYVHPQKQENDTWLVPIETTVCNDKAESKTVRILSEILYSGQTVASTATDISVAPYDKQTAESACRMADPKLWDIDSPHLYTLRTTIYDGEDAIDNYDTTFGFREIRFDKDKGFFINGRNEKIKGVCAHQDFGLMGLVLPASIARHRIRLFKEMGVNGYRCAHNMASTEEMDACDRMGMLVYAETRHFSSSEMRMEELRLLVKRDRNRPSVICWSVGNEEIYLSNTETGARIAERLHYEVKKYDKTRPTTAALSNSPYGNKALRHNLIAPLDIMSYNYSIDSHAEFRAEYPDKPFIVSECDALQTSRGHFYGDDPTAGLFHSYDHVIPYNEFNLLRSQSFAYAMENDSVAGLFVWAGTEHRGEAKWPRLCSQSGLIDLYLQKKEAFYQTKSQYDRTPMVHINPSSWNFAGLDGMPIKVVVFTNCSEVELILNDVSLGIKQTPPHYENPEWMVDYTRGELMAIGYKDGKEVCRDRIATTGKPHALRLYEDTVDAGAGEVHLFTCVCVDENGNEIVLNQGKTWICNIWEEYADYAEWN